MTHEEMLEMYGALKKAYYSGMLSVSYSDHSVTYRSAADMERAISRLEGELGIGGSADPLQNRKTGVTYKGL